MVIAYTGTYDNAEPLADVVSWDASAYFQDFGTVTMVAKATERNLSWIKNGNILTDGYRTYDGKTPFVYEIVDFGIDASNNLVTAHGKSIDWIFQRRSDDTIVWNAANPQTVFYYQLRNYASELGWSIDNYFLSSPATLALEFPQGRAGDGMISALKTCGCGRWIAFNPGGTNVLTVTDGRDVTNRDDIPTFCEENGSADNFDVSIDASNYANACRVTIFDQNGVNPEIVYAGEYWTTGKNLRMYTLGSLTQGADETWAALRDRATAEMNTELEKRKVRANVSFDISPKYWNDTYSSLALGDKIRWASQKYNVSGTAQIKGVHKVESGIENSIHIIAGDPTLNIIDLVRMGL